jgi:YHS domain-containing protein
VREKVVIRRLLAFLVLCGFGWLLLRAGRAARSSRSAPPSSGTMVRDRVCNTFLPLSQALVIEVAGTRHYFCSETCRSTFLGRLPA